MLNIRWKDWCWNWNSNTLATWCEELTHLKRPWCWERLRAGGEGVDRGWDGWMASPTLWTWVSVGSGSWWWTVRPGVLQSMGSQRVRHDWATELNWTEKIAWSHLPKFKNKPQKDQIKELLNKDLKTTIRYTSTFHILKKIVETMDMLRRYIKDIFLKIQIEFL